MVLSRPSAKSKDLLGENYRSFTRSGIDVFYNHMSLHIVCQLCVHISQLLFQMTSKVWATMANVTNASLVTSIVWEMPCLQNKNRQLPIDITPITNVWVLLRLSSRQNAYSVANQTQSKVIIAERKGQRPSHHGKKANAWEQIESRAEKMGLDRLHRLVKDKNLFALEAKHHPSCLRSFHTAFNNYERGLQRAKESKDTEHSLMSAAHEKAFILVREKIETHIVQQNEVIQLTSLRLN